MLTLKSRHYCIIAITIISMGFQIAALRAMDQTNTALETALNKFGITAIHAISDGGTQLSYCAINKDGATIRVRCDCQQYLASVRPHDPNFVGCAATLYRLLETKYKEQQSILKNDPFYKKAQ